MNRSDPGRVVSLFIKLLKINVSLEAKACEFCSSHYLISGYFKNRRLNNNPYDPVGFGMIFL